MLISTVMLGPAVRYFLAAFYWSVNCISSVLYYATYFDIYRSLSNPEA